MVTTPLTYEQLRDGIDGIYAYDGGSTDSGIKDEQLRKAIKTHFDNLTPIEHRTLLAKIIIDLSLCAEALEQGYGPEDAFCILTWMAHDMRILVPHKQRSQREHE